MRKKLFVFLLVFFCGLRGPAMAGIDNFGKTLDSLGVKDMFPQAGIDLDRVAEYLDWQRLNVSLRADMTSRTHMLGKTVPVDAVIYKNGITALRIDITGGLQVQEGAKTLSLVNCYLLEYPLKEKAFVVFPRKNGYMELDPEKIKDMLGDMIEKSKKNKGSVQKKEKLGAEDIDGRQCEKMHIVQATATGGKHDITTWLAKDLSGFPLKTLLQFQLPRGQTGTSSIVFSNIVKGEQESALFELPKEYEKYDNLVELATEGKMGSNLEKPQDRNRLFKRRQN